MCPNYLSFVDADHVNRFQSGNLIDLAMTFLRVREVKELVLNEKDDNFKRLKSFLKGLLVDVPKLKRPVKIQSLQDYAGEFVFLKDDQEELTVAVSSPLNVSFASFRY